MLNQKQLLVTKTKIMKNILKIICFLFFTINLSCKAQIVPLNNVDSPNGAYEKDLDNIFPFWIDTWKGTVNNKEYTFQFVKFTHHLKTYLNGELKYSDMLLVKFKVVDLSKNNQILYDDLNSTYFDDYKITFLANFETNYDFYFLDSEANCYNNAKFTLVKNNANNNIIEYKNFNGNYYEKNYNIRCNIISFKY